MEDPSLLMLEKYELCPSLQKNIKNWKSLVCREKIVGGVTLGKGSKKNNGFIH